MAPTATMSSFNSSSMGARSLAQDAVSWYLDRIDPLQSHAANVSQFLRGPVVALTLAVLHASLVAAPAAAEDLKMPFLNIDDGVSNNNNSTPLSDFPSDPLASSTDPNGLHYPTWREYLTRHGDHPANASFHEMFTSSSIKTKYDTLSRRAKARLDAFLEGVAIAVLSDEMMDQKASSRQSTKKSEYSTLSFLEGLGGFKNENMNSSESRSVYSVAANGDPKFSTKISPQQQQCAQLSESELVTRLELYLRSLHRVAALQNDCVIAQEPPKALKARTRSVVAAFIDTVGSVQNVNPVLTRLLTSVTKELLAVSKLSEELIRCIRTIISGYVHATSFASLAFLSSPETSADQRLTPAILQYLLYLQSNWEKCEADCEMERMLTTVLNSSMRQVFKTAEFQSIGHLLEVYQRHRDELHNIELPPSFTNRLHFGGDDIIAQAVKDVQREVIAVNGTILPHVSNRVDLEQLLTSALSTRTLFDISSRQRRSKKKRATVSGSRSDIETSGNEADFSCSDASTSENDSPEKTSGQVAVRRGRSKFRSSTVDLLIKRLLVAASRTGTGGDAFFVVRDLFGGDDVEVVASEYQPGAVRPATIDLLVRLASVTIKSHATFNIYPKSMVGESEPLIQIHATTTETIALQEVRSVDVKKRPDDDLNEGIIETVLQELPTERSGYRFLSVRPAVYEKVSSWHTPS